MAARVVKKSRPRYVLVIEDNVHHAELITETLDRYFAPIIIHTVDTVQDGIDFASRSDYDLIITGGIVSSAIVAEHIPKIVRVSEGTPIIVISGRGDERLAAEFIKRGAAEYYSKTRETLEGLPGILEKHFAHRPRRSKKKPVRSKDLKPGIPSPASIIREVDRLTQEALSIAGPRRRKRRLMPPDIEQLDRLLGQIQKLREMASKLVNHNK